MLISDNDPVPLAREQTWQPRFWATSQTMLDEAMRQRYLRPQDLAALVFLPPNHPLVRETEQVIVLISLMTQDAPVQ